MPMGLTFGTGTDPSGSTTTAVAPSLPAWQAAVPVALAAPRRLAVSDSGQLAVIDGRQDGAGQVTLLTAKGELRGAVALPEPARAAAFGGGFLWVTTAGGNLLKLDWSSGRVVDRLVPAGGPFGSPDAIAWDPTRRTLWVADSAAGEVRIVRPDGSTAARLTDAGGGSLAGVSDVAIDPARGKGWVLRFAPPAESALAAGAPLQEARFLHAFDLDGNYGASFVAVGSGAGKLTRAGGVAVGPDGRVYVTDTFQGTVQVFDAAGASTGTVGSFGTTDGALRNPAGLAILPNGDVAVANAGAGRVDRFGDGTPLPAACTVGGALDTDCDGLSDAWELAHGLDPTFAGDALLPFGRTGLNNAEVFAYQTKYGTDPWAPPAVVASAPASTPPGLVKLFATPSGPPDQVVACRWTQVAGPPVVLRDAVGIAPSFVARTPGSYVFEVVGVTALATGAPARVSVAVLNLPPVAEPGRVVVAAPGAPVRLDGGFSSDANGDAPALTWEQSLGAALTGTVPGPALVIRPHRPGLYRFLLTATDRGGLSSSAEVPVLVESPSSPTATAVAVATPAIAQVGDAVALDATTSLFADARPAFLWEQIGGPAATIDGAGTPVATFAPSAAGRYTFALTILGQGGRRSPPARVDVFVADPGRALPTVQSASAGGDVIEVNAPVALTASGTGTGWAWRQVAGPAAGLTDPDRAAATVVAFSPGWYAFEVQATDGAAVSQPARVAFEARAGGKPIPVAVVTTPAAAPAAGQLVFLDGRASKGASRFRWTQVAGPWVVASGGALATFRARDAGTYAFELEVDDGVVRSAPARIEIHVSEEVH
jgi:sugar lactone lactonase YvrE